MIKYNPEFLDLYEELSCINEENSGPLFFRDITVGNGTLLDYIDVDETRKLNNKLPEDPTNWRILEERSYVIKSPCLATCTRGFTDGGQSLRGQTIKKRLNKLSATSIVPEVATKLCLCNECNQIQNNPSGGGIINSTTPMSKVGYNCENGVTLVVNPDQSIWKYLVKDPTTADIPDGHVLPKDSKNWPPFKEGFSYTFICPNCFKSHKLLARTLARRPKEDRGGVTNLILCSPCAKAKSTVNTLLTSPAMEYLDKTIFKETSDSLILTDAGRSKILALNESPPPSAEKSDLNILSQLEKNINLDLSRCIAKSSKIIFPFICNNIDCKNYNGGKFFQYTARVTNVDRGVYHGCPSCYKLSGIGTSASEKLLRKSIEFLFSVEHKEAKNQPKIEQFKEIDILFEYPAGSGSLIGIEYDGKAFHKDPRTIQTDLRKTEAFTNIGVKFIRVREDGCYPFESPYAYCTNPPLKASLSVAGFEVLKHCLKQIGKFITNDDSYEIPKDKLEGLEQLYKDKSKWT